MLKAPIALFVYNRLSHTKATVEALMKNYSADKSDLYIFADGPKNSIDEESVLAVRKYIKTVCGFLSVQVVEQKKNLGLANSIIHGVSQVLEEHDSVVIFEDDIVSSPCTLNFLNSGLFRYNDTASVFSISAWSPPAKLLKIPADYPWDAYFVPRVNCWGWATWKDRWQKVDWQVKTYQAFTENSYLQQAFTAGGEDMPVMLAAQMAGTIDSWAVRFDFSRFSQGCVSLNPVVSFTKNIGMDDSGVHSRKNDKFDAGEDLSMNNESKLPDHVFVNERIGMRYKNAFSQPRIGSIEQYLAHGDYESAYALAITLKSLKKPIERLDFLRATIFMHRKDYAAAIQALREELRYFPNNQEAEALLGQLTLKRTPTVSGNQELDNLLQDIEPYTMVGIKRLQALYENAKKVCILNIEGNFVECGVAAGGTSGLLSAVLLQYDATEQKQLFAFDTFSGMPAPTSEDTHRGYAAQSTGWGTGTCAAPRESLLKLTGTLGTTHLVQPVQGLFADTLPASRELIGPIALLHMDGDWYESTRDILHNLYDSLVPGAYVQIDDYGHWEGCQKAVQEFFEHKKILITMHRIDYSGVWFQKPEGGTQGLLQSQ